MRPDTREAICLKLHRHRQPISRLRISLPQSPNLAFHPNNFLDVMSFFRRQDVRLREFARGPESLFQFVVKAQVDVDFFVRGAIERASFRFRSTASGLCVISEEHQLCMPVRSSRLLRENLRPGSLCVIQNEGHKLHQRLLCLITSGLGPARYCRSVGPWMATTQEGEKILLENQAQYKQHE